MPILRKFKRKEKGVEETVHLGALAQNITQDATHRFVTDVEKQAWNSKPGSTSGLDNNVVTFTEAATRENLQSGEKLSISLGKIKKWFSDLGAAAFMAVANNCTTTQPGSVLAAEQGKKLQDQISQVSSELHQNIFEDLGVFYDTGSLDATKFYKGLYQSNGKQYVFFQLPSVFSVQILFLNTEAEAEIDSIAFRISPGGNFSGIAWTWLKYSTKTPSA